MGLLEQIRSKLTSVGVVDGSNWKCFIGYLPDEQDQAICLTPTGGMPPDTLGRENLISHFQVRVRASSFAWSVCMNKWQAMYDALQDAQQTGVSPDDLAGIYFIQAMASDPISYTDEKNRHNMTANFRVYRSAV